MLFNIIIIMEPTGRMILKYFMITSDSRLALFYIMHYGLFRIVFSLCCQYKSKSLLIAVIR